MSRLLTRGRLLPLCLFAVLLCDVRPAWATCGDYLHRHGSSHMADARGPHAPRYADADFTHSQMPIVPQGHQSVPRPACSGPQCQRDHQTPAAPDKVVQVPTFIDGILAAFTVLDREEDNTRPSSADAEQAQSPAGRLFRPPRAAQ